MKKLRVASFFSGAGGLDLGFEQEGFDIVFASDVEPLFCQTLEQNRGVAISDTADIVCADIREFPLEKLPRDIDVVIGGPPCQSFSASGRRAGGAAGRLDERGNLFEAYKTVIGRLKPRAFVFENVRGIFGTNKGKDWEKITKSLEELGYRIDFRLLDAADYGAPQHRERVFLVGHQLGGEFLFPRPIYGPDSLSKKQHVSPREAFAEVKNSNADLVQTAFEGGKYSHLLPEVPEGQNYLYFTAKRGHPSPQFAYRSRFSDFLYKAHPDYPMKTIIASPGKYTGPLHWENRYFSIPEYKAIQGFPQGYQIEGDRGAQIKQIGNAVSPLIARQIARALKAQISGFQSDVSLLAPDERLSFDKRKGVKAKQTRIKHQKNKENGANIIKINNNVKNVGMTILPSKSNTEKNVLFNYDDENEKFTVDARYEDSSKLTVKSEILVFDQPRDETADAIATIEVRLYGDSPLAMQLFWNSVDEWVRLATTFQSLFELYGHFTEPYPYFRVAEFRCFSSDSFFKFAKYTTDFGRCSVYLPKDKLLADLGAFFNVKHFDELANILRDVRYDVRTKETNVAIPSTDYMMAYPFTLPMSKQMNFSIKKPKTNLEAEAYIYEKRISA